MKVRNVLIAMALSMIAVLAAAEPVVVQGEELKSYVVGEKGRTFTMVDGQVVSFFPNGAFIDCAANKEAGCDTGTYTVEEKRIMRKYETWKYKGSNLMPVAIKRDDNEEYFNASKIAVRSDVPTLTLSSRTTMGEAQAVTLSPEELAAKKAAASAFLKRDLVEMTVAITDFGGTRLSFDVRIYPRQKLMKLYGSGSYCEIDERPIAFFITEDGDVWLKREPRMAGCSEINLLIDVVAKKVYTANRTSTGGIERRTGESPWRLK